MQTKIVLNGNDGKQIVGIGEASILELYEISSWDEIDSFIAAHRGETLFITISYELRHQILNGTTTSKKNEFPLIRIWQAEKVWTLQNEQIVSPQSDSENHNFFKEFNSTSEKASDFPVMNWQPKQSKTDYCSQVNYLKEHIQLGNMYEVNYCQEFYAENIHLESIQPIYNRLNKHTTTPFSAWIETEKWMVACASPERFIKKTASQLMSQPIKGTAPRGKNEEEDLHIQETLRASRKEQSENHMIVDLVRNDLSKIATKGSVNVDELVGLYTFPTVHQLISTISCEVKSDTTFTDILRATFPMGSMTGAPKKAAVQFSEETERFTRGLYSGSIGIIYPNGDFDLNVVIRSLIYDVEQQRVSCAVGGAITHLSNPEEEYIECQTKVGKILSLFGPSPW